MNTKKISLSLNTQNVYCTENVCFLCGWNETNNKEFKKGKKILSANFNDATSAQAKESDLICGFCQDCLKDDIIDTESWKTAGVRAFSFLVDYNWRKKINLKDGIKFFIINFPEILY